MAALEALRRHLSRGDLACMRLFGSTLRKDCMKRVTPPVYFSHGLLPDSLQQLVNTTLTATPTLVGCDALVVSTCCLDGIALDKQIFLSLIVQCRKLVPVLTAVEGGHVLDLYVDNQDAEVNNYGILSISQALKINDIINNDDLILEEVLRCHVPPPVHPFVTLQDITDEHIDEFQRKIGVHLYQWQMVSVQFIVQRFRAEGLLELFHTYEHEGERIGVSPVFSSAWTPTPVFDGRVRVVLSSEFGTGKGVSALFSAAFLLKSGVISDACILCSDRVREQWRGMADDMSLEMTTIGESLPEASDLCIVDHTFPRKEFLRHAKRFRHVIALYATNSLEDMCDFVAYDDSNARRLILDTLRKSQYHMNEVSKRITIRFPPIEHPAIKEHSVQLSPGEASAYARVASQVACSSQLRPLLADDLELKRSILACLLEGERHPDLSSVRVVQEAAFDDRECSVCRDEICGPTTLPCGHVFCIGCITQWSLEKETCPTCRAPFGILERDQCVGKRRAMEVAYQPIYGKMDAVQRLVDSLKGTAIVVCGTKSKDTIGQLQRRLAEGNRIKIDDALVCMGVNLKAKHVIILRDSLVTEARRLVAPGGTLHVVKCQGTIDDVSSNATLTELHRGMHPL